eukprot:7188619-Pyramimonas_sp.AAC.2
MTRKRSIRAASSVSALWAAPSTMTRTLAGACPGRRLVSASHSGRATHCRGLLPGCRPPPGSASALRGTPSTQRS